MTGDCIRPRSWSRIYLLLAAQIFAALSLPLCNSVQAETGDRRIAHLASNTGLEIYLVAGLIVPLAEDSKEGRDYSLRTLDALGVSILLSEGLKRSVREKRPESEERTSFPSGHAATAFSIATAESQFHPKQAPYWYGGAALISWSRVRLHRHFPHDVLAGAALGYFTTRWALSRPRGVILTPLIHPRDSKGLQATLAF